MAVNKLTTEQIDGLVNEAYSQSVGATDVAEMDLTKFADEGVSDVQALRSKYTGKLIGLVTNNFFTQTSAESEYDDPFYQDEREFGAITQMISAQIPEARENSAWQDFVSGVTKVGEYTVYLPTIDTSYYTKQVAWGLPFDFSGEQWNQAFKDAAGVRGMVDYIFMIAQNGIMKHRENMNETNRNNYLAQKIQHAAEVGATGVHVVDLVEKFAVRRGLSSFTVAEALASDDYKAFAMSQLGAYASYMRKQSGIFTADGSVRFVPTDRLIVQVLDEFDREMAVTKAGIYHNELIKMPGYKTVAAWQGLGELDFETLSSLNVKTSAGTLDTTGIVAVMVDKWAVLHTIKKQRIGVQRFDIEDLTHYEYQFVDAYMNNLNMPGIVFVMSDYTA